MQILSVNVGKSQPMTVKYRNTQTGIYKIPVKGAVAVSRMGLQDDVRIEVRKMGLEHSAVYVYPHEHYDYWQNRLECELFPFGQFGENLTVKGLLEDEVRIGDIFRFGETVLQVAHPRIPCVKLNTRMGLRFASMFLASCKVGYYMRVLEEGNVSQGDGIELLERDENSPTMEEFVRIAHYEYWDTQALKYLLKSRDLLPAWRENIEEKIERSQKAIGWNGLREFEVVNRQQESQKIISLDLKCAQGKELPSFFGGQRLMFVPGKPGEGGQKRQPFYLSSNPKDCSTYRVSLYTSGKNEVTGDSSVSDILSQLKPTERIRCNAPYGEKRSLPEKGFQKKRLRVLVSQGLGIAPTLSILYELEGYDMNVHIFHQADASDPQTLLNEVNELLARNPNFKMFNFSFELSESISAEFISEHGQLAKSDIDIAGSKLFVDRLMNEFMALDFAPAALVMRYID